jgi:outer membrane protein OmpA-like peptidoglycan-associated protein
MKTRTCVFLVVITCYLYQNSLAQDVKDTSINLYFATNSSQLDSTQYQELKDFSSLFHIISIKGYADSTGAPALNYSLSQKRALSVYNALREMDSAHKINMMYLGESNEEPELWKNRRVQIIASVTKENEVEHQIPTVALSNDKRVEVIRTMDLEYVYFMPDQAIITQESLYYVQKLADILKTYKTETFEIIGHINYQSRFDSTHLRDIYQLSERRARAVYDLLVESGIPANRMTFKGVGNSQPIYPSPQNDEQRRKNMRVQVVIKK